MGLKDIFHGAEDKWYALLDRIEEKVPIYAIIDPIDRIVPSFAVFLGIIALLILTLGILPFFGGTDVVVGFTDTQGAPIAGLSIHAEWGTTSTDLVTSSVGKIVLHGIPIGSTLTLSAEDPQYETFSQSKEITESNPTFTFSLAPRILPPAQLSFQFVDGSGLSLDGKTFQVSLTCSSGVDLPQSQYTVSNGILVLTPPVGCGNLVGSISGNGITRQDGILFSGDNTIIHLSGLSTEKGKAKITVRSQEDDAILPGMEVQLFTADGGEGLTITTNTFGVAIFNDTPVGSYYASVRDPQGDYALTTSAPFDVVPNQTVSVDVGLGRQVQGTLTVSVTDQLTNAKIANATVKLVDKATNQLLTSQLTTTDENPVTLSVSAKGPFILSVTHPDYLSESQDIGLVTGDQTHAFALERLTAQNSGKITVGVVDEDGIPIDNAQVTIYDAASGFIAHAYNPAITDSNGNARFQGIQSGTYFARATKYPAGPSDSPKFTTDKSIPATTSISLRLGEASVQAIVKDVDGNPVPFATVEYRTDGTDECTPGKCVLQTDALGVVSKTFKADRKIFIRASASGFSAYTSLSQQLYPNLPNTITVKLPHTILGNSPKIALSRIQDPVTGGLASEIKSGKTYRAVFQIQIPSAMNNLDGGGAHIRVGDEAFLENDALQITGVSAPDTVIVKGTSYQPTLGYTEDQTHLTNGNAKWVNLQWGVLEPGIYEIGVDIRVDEQATPLESLPIYYRAWVTHGSVWTRDPVDAILGNAASASGRDAQYAETYQQIYFNGKPIVCDESFCYSGESVLNQDDTLLVDGPPYPLTVNKAYQYSFVLSSNATTIYQNPKLRVFVSNDETLPSHEMQFTGYHVIGTQGQPLDGSGLATNDVPGGEGQGIPVGRMEQFKTIVGQFSFLAKETTPTKIVVQLINEGDIVFQQIIPVSIASLNTLSVNVDPSTAAAFLPTHFEIHTTSGNGFDIQDARVTLLKIDPNQSQQIVNQQFTDATGKATIIAPPSLPNTHFVFDAVKGGYSANPVTIVVDGNVVVFDPVSLTFSLPNAPNTDQFLPLDIRNNTQEGLTISRATLTGDFQGLLSNTEMQNWVGQYVHTLSVNSLETKTIQVKASTSPTVNVVNGKTLHGNLILGFQKQGSGQEWIQNVPLNVGIKIISACDDEAIQISGTPGNGTIETSAFDNATQIPFTVDNICHVEGKAFPLQNLKAKITWHSNPIGNVEVAMTDIAGSNTANEVLKNAVYTPLYDVFKTADDSEYQSVLTFTPFPGHIGETADFTITIAADAGAGNSIQTLTKTFDLKIKVTNFESCVKFTPEPEEGITLHSGDDEAEFEVNTTGCGNVPVDIQFCNGSNNSNCSGGAPQGRLFLSQFSINNLEGTKTIKVQRKAGTLPGSYDLTVDARIPGTSLRRIASLNVKVESDDSYAFDMEKTDMTLYQKNARDSTVVKNKWLAENVEVKASVCDWQDAMDSGFGGANGTNLAIGAASGIAFSYIGAAYLPGFVSSTFWCPVCVAVAVIVVIILDLFDDPCDHNDTHTLQDYIINLAGGTDSAKLPPDAVSIELSNNVASHVGANWVTDVSNIFTKNGVTQQTVGLTTINKTGYSDPNPLFGVMTLVSKIHDNGDPTHSGHAKVTCNNAQFGPFNLGPTPAEGSCTPTSDSGTHREDFHVKFRTQDLNQSLPNLTADTVACVSGTTLGATGTGILPKVAFTWSWNDTTGIGPYSCDASRPGAIYCDATQFNISLMKRMKILDTFLQANNYTFACPTNPTSQPASQNFPNPDPIPSGFIGYTSVGYAFQSNSIIRFSGTVTNQTNTSQTATLGVTMNEHVDEGSLAGGSGLLGAPLSYSCSNNVTVAPGASQSVECTITGISSAAYLTNFTLSSNTTSNIAYLFNSVTLDTQSYSNASTGSCNDLIKTTALIAGKPAINWWIDQNDPQFGQYVHATPHFTTEVPDIATLTNLLHYDALLIRDGYSHDFENDFRDYYSTNAFADAPSWFKGGNGVAGFNAFYGDDDPLTFGNEFFDDTTLAAAGKYRVNINALFGDNWQLIDANGAPKAKVGVTFYQLENPVPNSPFYKLPFDGQVGLVNTTYDRVGYGLEFINENAPIKVNDSLVQTNAGPGSTAVGQVNVSEATDLRTLNSNPSTRGNILEVDAAAGSAEQAIKFTPSLATPVMLKVTHSASTQPFSVFYQVSQNGSPVQVGNTLTFWEGVGTCYDYTGVPVFERFNFTPDRGATPQDHLTAWQYSYALDWPQARAGGDEYLRTILYTPANGGSFQFSIENGGAKLFTSNYSQPSTSQLLDGISTLPYNNASQTIDSIQDVFDLVSSGKICVSDSGAKARFFWNPQTLYQQTGQISITAATNALVAGQTCLGAPST